MKTAVLVIISIIFIPLFLFVILFVSLDSTILNPDLINSKLQKAQAYQKLATDVIPNTISQLFSSASESVSQSQIVENIYNELSDKINSSWVRNELSSVYSKSVDYIKDKTKDKNININLKPLSDIFTKENLFSIVYTDEYIQEQYDSLPICSDSKTQELCREESLSYDEFEKSFKEEVEKSENPMEEVFPENINIYESLKESDNINTFDTLQRVYKAFQTTFYIFLAICIAIIVTIIALLYKEKSRLFKYLGIIFIIPSAPVLIFSVISYFVYSGFISNVFLAMQIPQSTVLLIVSIIGSIVGSMLSWLLVISLVFFIASIIFFILASKNKNKQIKKEA